MSQFHEAFLDQDFITPDVLIGEACDSPEERKKAWEGILQSINHLLQQRRDEGFEIVSIDEVRIYEMGRKQGVFYVLGTETFRAR